MHKIIDNIKEIVKEYVCEKRFYHTLGVAKEAYALGLIFMPEKAEKLKLAGLLHDITKDFSTQKQLELCKEYGIVVNMENLVPKLLHSKTGSELARRKFGDIIVDNEIYNGILFHTTGRENMTLFESIIYLADYIEETRTFEDCIKLREFFYSNVNNSNSYQDKIQVLKKTMIYSFNLTIEGLIHENKRIDIDTIKARNYFVSCKNVFTD